MLNPHTSGTTVIHTLWPGAKILTLMSAGTLLVFVSDWRLHAIALVVVLSLFAIARLPAATLWRSFRPLMPILAVVIAAQLYLDGIDAAATSGLRLTTLLLLASLVTLTTPAAGMMSTVERAIRPLSRFGVDSEKVSLALSLALRFVPMLGEIHSQIREAQRARGIEKGTLALAVPLIVRSLKAATDIADAIDARGFASRNRGQHDNG